MCPAQLIVILFPYGLRRDSEGLLLKTIRNNTRGHCSYVSGLPIQDPLAYLANASQVRSQEEAGAS